MESSDNGTKPVKRNSLMADDMELFDPSILEDDDWNDVFDDDPPADNIDTDPNFALLMPPPADKNNFSSPMAVSSMSNSTSNMKKVEAAAGKRRRKLTDIIDGAEKDGPAASWHNEGGDMSSRQAMIRDIAQLLYARKKDNPCGKWLQRLPLKARMLENQLYKNAASLEAYFDRSTLKGRLGKLASAITSHYKQAMERRGSSGNSTTSNPSEGNSTTSNPSIPFLGYGEDAFAETKLRRLSSESMPSSKASSVPPISGASDSAVMRGGQSNSGSAAKRSLAAISGPLHPLSEIPDGKDSSRGKKNKTTLRGNTSTNNPLLETLSSNNNMMLNAGGRIPQWAAMNNMMMGGGMNNSMNSGMSNAMNNAMGGGMGNGVGGGMGNGVGGGMGNGVGSGMNNAMGGGMNNGMMALHQLQHQQRALMMQQQQQQQNMSGMSMANLVALQQQQQQQIPNGAMSMANANSGMNMVNMSALPNVIPGGGGSFPSFPMNNGNNASMPPPQALNGMGAPGSGNASNDATSPLSPGSFHW